MNLLGRVKGELWGDRGRKGGKERVRVRDKERGREEDRERGR